MVDNYLDPVFGYLKEQSMIDIRKKSLSRFKHEQGELLLNRLISEENATVTYRLWQVDFNFVIYTNARNFLGKFYFIAKLNRKSLFKIVCEDVCGSMRLLPSVSQIHKLLKLFDTTLEFGFKPSYNRIKSNKVKKEEKPNIKEKDKFHFVLALTSNPGAEEFEKQLLENSTPLYIKVTEECQKYATEYNNIGLVVGATQNEMSRIRARAPKLLFLIPGVGKQGGSYQEAISSGKNSDGLAIINVSRSILYCSQEKYFNQKMKELLTTYQI
ncbi:orotidine 5'-phosphate decarboxylase / HUMPS family protein [Candidatus Margulisiibacteriota bacterium]